MEASARGLAITLDLAGATVVVVGDDQEAQQKIELAVEAGARVRQIAAPRFEPADLDGARLVLLTPRDPELARRVAEAARARGVLVWACDDPGASNLAMPALARLGRARIAVSTSGASPVLAGRVRAALEAGLGERFARFVDALGELRARLRDEEPDAERRRERLRAALDGFGLEVSARYPDWFK
jgi:precorrin-2 dehydrogenase/sirohydrochlorin ferrochelatase